MVGSPNSGTTSTSTNNRNVNNLNNHSQTDDKYTAKRNDGQPNTKNRNVHGKDSSKSTTNPSKNTADGNNNNQSKTAKSNNKDNSKPKAQAQQKAKEQAATTAMTALGVPVPIAKALSKPVANKLDKKGMLPEAQRIKQGQERLNNIRNAIQSQKEPNNEEAEEDSPSLIDQVQNIGAKAENVKGIIKILKALPPPVWGILFAVIFLLGALIIFAALSSTPVFGGIMNDYAENINDSSSASTVQGDGVAKGTLVLPVDSSSGYSWTNTSLYYSSGRYHGGNDISVATGTSVFAMDGGTVVSADTTTNKSNSCSSGYNSEGYCSFGKFIGIKHEIEGKTYYSVYAHLSSISVNVGDKVTQGQEIGKSGNTGNSSGPHLHIAFAYNYYGTTGAPVYNRGIITPYTYISGNKKGQSYVGDVGKNY